MSATLATSNTALPLRPLAETAALFRQECFALDHLVEELYRDVENLRDELIRKSDELEENRKKLAERGRQLATERKESGRLVHLLEQQETQLGETLGQIKALGEQTSQERQEAKERESARFAFFEQRLRAAEAERDELRHELNVLQATAAGEGATAGEHLAPLMAELGDMRRQLSDTQSQLAEARAQLTASIEQSAATPQPTNEPSPALMAELAEMRRQLSQTQSQVGDTQTQLVEARALLTAAIEQSAAAPMPTNDPPPALMAELAEMRRQLSQTQSQLSDTQAQLGEARVQLSEAIGQATAAAVQSSALAAHNDGGQPADEATLARLSGLERERVELESELELVRTRATELQEVVNQQRRELVEQRADITTELRLLRELVEQRPSAAEYEADEEPQFVGAATRGEPSGSAPDPVVSSVMAQFARLQKDVAQRRKKK